MVQRLDIYSHSPYLPGKPLPIILGQALESSTLRSLPQPLIFRYHGSFPPVSSLPYIIELFCSTCLCINMGMLHFTIRSLKVHLSSVSQHSSQCQLHSSTMKCVVTFISRSKSAFASSNENSQGCLFYLPILHHCAI